MGRRKSRILDAGENNGWEFISLYEGRYSGKVRFPAAEVDSAQVVHAGANPGVGGTPSAGFLPAFIPCWNACLVANRKIILTQIHIMINPDQLSPEQIQSIRTWAEEGLDLKTLSRKGRMRT